MPPGLRRGRLSRSASLCDRVSSISLRRNTNLRPSWSISSSMSWPRVFSLVAIISTSSSPTRMPSRSGMWFFMPVPPLSSPPMSMSSSSMRSHMYLKPTGTTWSLSPYFSQSLSIIEVVDTVLTTLPVHPLTSLRCFKRSAKTMWELMKRPVRVAVHGDTDLVLPRDHRFGKLVQVVAYRLGQKAREERVVDTVDLVALRSEPLHGLWEVALPRSVHRVEKHPDAAFCCHVCVNDRDDLFQVPGPGVEELYSPPGQDVLEENVGPPRRVFLHQAKLLLDRCRDGRGGRASVGRLELDPVISGRVVARGYHYRAVGGEVHGRVRD